MRRTKPILSRLSIVIPVKDEEESLRPLHKEITTSLKRLKKKCEIIYVNDGSQDKSAQVLKSIQRKNKNVQIVTFHANQGKSAALSVGFELAKGGTLLTLDADLQDNPADISKFLKKLDEGYDFVIGHRVNRKDTTAKRISSKLFNKGTSFISGVKLHDFNCGMKAMKYYVVEDVDLHGELHRFMPILAARKKYMVAEVPVHNRPRKFGRSKYGFERSWKGIVDLITTIFLTTFVTKPAHFFGSAGLLFFVSGTLMNIYVTAIKIATGTTQGKIPLLLAGVLCMMIGVQLISIGLIGEMIVSINRQKKPPHIVS